MFEFVKQSVLLGVAQMFPPLNPVILWIGNTFYAKEQATHREFVVNAVNERLKKATDRPDLSAPLPPAQYYGVQLTNEKYDVHPEEFGHPKWNVKR